MFADNFMDYSYDACLDSFSKGELKPCAFSFMSPTHFAGQISRLQDQMATFRGVNFSSS